MNWKKVELKYNYNHNVHQECEVGIFVISEPTKYRKYEETASRDHDVMVPAGKYPVVALKVNGRRWHSLLIRLPEYGTLQMYGYLLARSENFIPNDQARIVDGDLIGVDGSRL